MTDLSWAAARFGSTRPTSTACWRTSSSATTCRGTSCEPAPRPGGHPRAWRLRHRGRVWQERTAAAAAAPVPGPVANLTARRVDGHIELQFHGSGDQHGSARRRSRGGARRDLRAVGAGRIAAPGGRADRAPRESGRDDRRQAAGAGRADRREEEREGRIWPVRVETRRHETGAGDPRRSSSPCRPRRRFRCPSSPDAPRRPAAAARAGAGVPAERPRSPGVRRQAR